MYNSLNQLNDHPFHMLKGSFNYFFQKYEDESNILRFKHLDNV